MTMPPVTRENLAAYVSGKISTPISSWNPRGECCADRARTLADRAAAFNRTYAKWPAARLHVTREADREILYGRWLLGNDYRARTPLYGAFPPGLLDRIRAIFPENLGPTLHVFSGSLPAGPYVRCDLVQPAELACSVYDLPERYTGEPFRLVIADPPYSIADARMYGTPMIDRRKALAAIAEVTAPGAFCCWLDTVWPMHRKREWCTVGRIAVTRSTNHRIRDLTIFERVAP